MPRTVRNRLTLTALSLLLSACGGLQGGPLDPRTTDRPGHVAPRYDVAVVASVTPADDARGLERELGGRVLELRTSGCSDPTTPESCFALLGMSEAEAGMLRSAASGRTLVKEPNRGAIDDFDLTTRAAGTLRVWSGGTLRVWSGGTLRVWSGGQYTPIPENDALWDRIHLEEAHTLASGVEQDVVVAVIDTGIDLTHPALVDTLAPSSTWRDFYADDLYPAEEGRWDTPEASPAYGHGTAVAGIIAQVAPGAKIMPLRVLGPDGSGDAVHVARAIDWAVEKGARIINLSLGSDTPSRAIQDAVTRATRAGVFVTMSAGNEGHDGLTYPAQDAASGTGGQLSLSVGSVDLSDRKSSFSNYGSALELVAPGENVHTSAPEGRLVAWSGTSMAAPMAAGGLALALGTGRALTRQDLSKQLLDNADDIYANGLNAAYKDKLGRGRLNLERYLRRLINGTSTAGASS